MSSGRDPHDAFAEQAAAYALDALSDEDRERFLGHLESCAACQQEVADLLEVGAELGEATGGPEPPPELRNRVLGAAFAAGPAASSEAAGSKTPAGWPDEPPIAETASAETPSAGGPTPAAAPAGTVTVLRRSGRARRRPLLVAVAAAVLVLGGLAGGLAAALSGGAPVPSPSCARQRTCTVVTLTSATTRRAAATVVVEGGSVWMRAAHLAPDDTSRQTYVLWEIAGHHAPEAVGAFDVRAGQHGAIAVGSLGVSLAKVSSFAVSLEPGRRAPKTPSDIVAVGRLT